MAKYKPRHAGGNYYQGKSSASKGSRYSQSLEADISKNEITPPKKPQTVQKAPTQSKRAAVNNAAQPPVRQSQPQYAAPKQRAAQHAAPKPPVKREVKETRYVPMKPQKADYRPSGFALALRVIISTLAALGIVFFLIPIAKSYFTITSVVAVAFLALLIVHVNIKRILTDDGERRALSVVWHVVSVVFLLCVCWVGFVTFQMINVDESEPQESTTVVVLGAKVYQTGVSVALQNRLNTALEYLNENPSSKVVVTGGQGSDEPWSEASAAKDYLVAQGIKEDRILTEDKSTSTEENLSYSKSILAENNLGSSIVLVTQSFHMFRASSQAKDQGYTVYCMPCATNKWLLPTYYSREVLAITKYYITKVI